MFYIIDNPSLKSKNIEKKCLPLFAKAERKLLKYVRIAGKAKGSTDQVLLQLLEMLLDNILFRLGMAPTIPGARQLVNHRHILVNGRIVDIPSYRCKPRDTIAARDEQKSRALIQNSLDSSPHEELPNHLTLQPFQYKGLVNQIIDRFDQFCSFSAKCHRPRGIFSFLVYSNSIFRTTAIRNIESISKKGLTVGIVVSIAGIVVSIAGIVVSIAI
ncbi:hypothetical protein R6Q59_006453 [Mikania micrantha]